MSFIDPISRRDAPDPATPPSVWSAHKAYVHRYADRWPKAVRAALDAVLDCYHKQTGHSITAIPKMAARKGCSERTLQAGLRQAEQMGALRSKPVTPDLWPYRTRTPANLRAWTIDPTLIPEPKAKAKPRGRTRGNPAAFAEATPQILHPTIKALPDKEVVLATLAQCAAAAPCASTVGSQPSASKQPTKGKRRQGSVTFIPCTTFPGLQVPSFITPEEWASITDLVRDQSTTAKDGGRSHAMAWLKDLWRAHREGDDVATVIDHTICGGGARPDPIVEFPEAAAPACNAFLAAYPATERRARPGDVRSRFGRIVQTEWGDVDWQKVRDVLFGLAVWLHEGRFASDPRLRPTPLDWLRARRWEDAIVDGATTGWTDDGVTAFLRQHGAMNDRAGDCA